MSDDGRRVFYQTATALVPQDTNGQTDVYEWTPSGVSLISSGRSHEASFVLDNSASGDDVFFATTAGLDPRDTDGSYDVYDARVGGGFKLAEVAAPCEGDGCQGQVSKAPSLMGPGGAGVSVSGNQPPAGGSASVARLKLGARRVVGGVLQVTVTVTGPGRVTVSGSGLQTVKKSYATKGTFTLKASLTVKARRSLKSKHRLKLGVRVGFTPRSGAASSATFVLNAKA
jgi:hypothetical protein